MFEELAVTLEIMHLIRGINWLLTDLVLINLFHWHFKWCGRIRNYIKLSVLE